MTTQTDPVFAARCAVNDLAEALRHIDPALVPTMIQYLLLQLDYTNLPAVQDGMSLEVETPSNVPQIAY